MTYKAHIQIYSADEVLDGAKDGFVVVVRWEGPDGKELVILPEQRDTHVCSTFDDAVKRAGVFVDTVRPMATGKH